MKKHSTSYSFTIMSAFALTLFGMLGCSQIKKTHQETIENTGLEKAFPIQKIFVQDDSKQTLTGEMRGGFLAGPSGELKGRRGGTTVLAFCQYKESTIMFRLPLSRIRWKEGSKSTRQLRMKFRDQFLKKRYNLSAPMGKRRYDAAAKKINGWVENPPTALDEVAYVEVTLPADEIKNLIDSLKKDNQSKPSAKK